MLIGYTYTFNLDYHRTDLQNIDYLYFFQAFYFICASSLNNLLLRKDLCHWTKGIQIRYNLSHLEQWARDQKLSDANIIETLHPIIQASHLLQARKTEEDVKSLCEMCDKLTVQRVSIRCSSASRVETFRLKKKLFNCRSLNCCICTPLLTSLRTRSRCRS